MSSLRVLSLRRNDSLTELPSRISSLVSLHHLDLSLTHIRGLPQELKALEKLRYLNLEYTHYLSIIPHQLISGFLKLEVLRLLECGSEGVTKEEGNVLCDDAEPLMRELLGLKRLNVLSWSFRSSLAVQKFFKYPKLDLTWLVFVQNLKELEIIVCTEMEEIICVDKLRDVSDISEIIGSEHNFFTQLESLGILYGPDLKSIYPNPLHFPKLKKIGVYGCPKLKKLPINSSSAKERRVVIEGLKEWWEELQWEDQATQNAFSSGVILGGD
ncbi:probable disease resistance protein At1g62630 [Citrus sinensis]|uniref:probable disease resistance protein At1g62630 n=1 Tax=Citrus sinensis TaxID=2711 RepID=UPI002277427C|nr:probable disease resistance protein At1g62630 [Citrus sinensis]